VPVTQSASKQKILRKEEVALWGVMRSSRYWANDAANNSNAIMGIT
jgi:hypothetical protein